MDVLAEPLSCRTGGETITRARQRRYAKGRVACRACFRRDHRGARPTTAELATPTAKGPPKLSEAPTSTWRQRAANLVRRLFGGGK